MIKEFKQNTKDVFMMIKNNSNNLFIRYLGYILIVLLFPLLFLADFIDWLIRIRGNFKYEQVKLKNGASLSPFLIKVISLIVLTLKQLEMNCLFLDIF